jgi:Lrp/AsnC family transcriptional regulator
MDQTDIKILALLQKDATCSVAEIAEQVHLSVTPCWRRIQKLKDDGVIARNAILLDPRALGLNLTVFVSIKTSQHNEKWTQSLISAVMALPNVVEFHRMAGDVDYLLKVVVEDMAAYDRFYRRLIGAVDLLDVSASFSMEVGAGRAILFPRPAAAGDANSVRGLEGPLSRNSFARARA